MKKLLRLCATALVAAALFVGCSSEDTQEGAEGTNEASEATSSDEELTAQAEEILATLSLEEKVAQLFIITPEALTGYDTVTAAGRVSQNAFESFPVGGLVYAEQNLQDAGQTQTMLENMQTYSTDYLGIPLFLCIEEEGGDASVVANADGFSVISVDSAQEIGQTADAQAAYDAAETIAAYLSELGFNVNFAPVADVVEDAETSVIGNRSFGSDADVVAAMVSAQVEAYADAGILSCVKHFPGMGSVTVGGSTVVRDSLAELTETAFVPFEAAIDAGVSMIMVGHMGLSSVTGSSIPVSFSSEVIEGVLRGDLGYDGLVITEALADEAVTSLYSDRRIGVEVLLAGADIIYMPSDASAAFEGIMDALDTGELTEERIDESVLRIIKAKLTLG